MSGHGARAHAILSASGAHRWMNCPASALREDEFSKHNPPKSSVYAEEGTLCHEFGELFLQAYLNPDDKKYTDKELAKKRKHALYSKELEIYALEYAAYVIEAYQETLSADPSALLLVEQRLDFSDIVPGGFGTGDALIVGNKTARVIDLKYGKGVKVGAEQNPQLMLYAYAAWQSVVLSHDVTTFEATVYQPRLNHVDTYHGSVEMLEEWAQVYVARKAEEAMQPDARDEAGDWCRFCKVSAICRKNAEKQLETARKAFQDPATLSDEELVKLFEQGPALASWVKSIADYMTEQAHKGHAFPGLKLVEGRKTRAWKDEAAVAAALEAEGVPREEYIKETVQGVPWVEKKLGKAWLKDHADALLGVKSSAPSLVPASDKRPPYDPAQAARDAFDD